MARVESAALAEFPALGDSLVSGLASRSAVCLPPNVVQSPTAGAPTVDHVVDQACDSFLSVYDLFGDISSISNDSLDDLMFSYVEWDPNVERSVGVNISTEAVLESISTMNEKNVNVNDETVVTVNAVGGHAVPASTLNTAAQRRVNIEMSNAAVSGNDAAAAANVINENINGSDKEAM